MELEIMDDLKTNVVQQSAAVQQSFLADRSAFMGFAILIVVLYHLGCVFHPYCFGVAQLLGRGYVGVDIFFFLSAFGLCYSYTKNGIRQFYINRFVRIYPLYFIFATLYSFTFTPIVRGGFLGVWDYFCNITSLSYYRILGGSYSNWYIDALIVFYIFFPLVFKKVKGGGGLLLYV